MPLRKNWAGHVFGTNTGNLFVQFQGDDATLVGTLRFNELGVGIVIYSIRGSFDGVSLALSGVPTTEIPGYTFGELTASANLNDRGELSGEWSTTIGSAGTFKLFPHESGSRVDEILNNDPDQLYTTRYEFGAVELNRSNILYIADEIQKEFKDAQLVVTVVAGTDQSRFLNDFRGVKFSESKISAVKLFVQGLDGSVNRLVKVEFGPAINEVITQGRDETWALGILERIKMLIKPFERLYATGFKKYGVGFNQVIMLFIIVVLPSLSSLQDRFILMISVLVLIFLVKKIHERYIPYAAIYLDQKPLGVFRKVAPTAISWGVSATAGVVAALLAAYLQGWLVAAP